MRIAILGCGYVGIALAEDLVSRDHRVIGVRRSADGLDAIEAIGAESVRADLTEPAMLADIPSVDTVVVAASSGGEDAQATREVMVEGLKNAVTHFGRRDERPKRIIYTSTTGVYGDHHGDWVDETTRLAPGSPKSAVYAEAEVVCRETSQRYKMEPIIARLGGIYGPDRYRIEAYLDRPVTPGYRNFVHRRDVVGALSHFTTVGSNGHDTVLVVDDEPVERYEFVSWLADQVGVSPPPRGGIDELTDRSERSIRRLKESKRCDNSRLRRLGYELHYPTFREGYAEAIRNFET